MEKLRNNYNLCNILVRIAFVLTFVFANWQNALSVTVMFLGSSDFWIAMAADLMLGVIFMVVMPFVAKAFLNIAKIYTVPQSEYNVLVHAFFSLGFLVYGLLSLVNIFTPLALSWGGVLFPIVAALSAAIPFYKVTVKLYFNSLTEANYFKWFSIVFLVALLVLEVL